MKQQIINNDLELLKSEIDKINPKNIFVLTGKFSYLSSGANKFINTIFKNKEFVEYNKFSPNPKLLELLPIIEYFNQGDFDLIVSIGGGSVMDTGKIVKILSSNPGDALSFINKEKQITSRGVPLITIPTTAGSGSESTHFAVLHINGVKYSLAHEYILPDIAYLDQSLTENLPRHIAAASSLDALSQAIEAFWSNNAIDESKSYSREALRLIALHLKNRIVNNSHESREGMILAANYAGRAINIAKTTASHALSYTLASLYGIQHGHAVCLTLGGLLRYNYLNSDDEGTKNNIQEIIEILNLGNVDEFTDYLRKIMQLGNLPTRLSHYNPTSQEIDKIISSVNLERLKNNPVELNQDDIREILLKSY